MHAARMPFAARSTFSAVRPGFLAYKATITTFIGFGADSVTVHTHEYVYLSILRSSVSTFSVNLVITVWNVTSRNKYSDV